MNKQTERCLSDTSQRFGLDTIWQAETQNAIFRSLMTAMSRPGKVQSLAKVLELSGSNIATAVLATLSDAQVSACNLDNLVSEEDWAMSQCVSSTADVADYIVADGGKACAVKPKLGTLVSPDLSATLILLVDHFGIGDGYRITGPGIDGFLTISIDGLDKSWVHARSEWVCGFPMGVDLVLLSSSSLMALPRTTIMDVAQ